MKDILSQVVPSRSKFQLKHFVIGQHPTLPAQWKQIVLEIQDLEYKIRNTEIELKKLKLKRESLINSSNEEDILNLQQIDLNLLVTNRVLNGAKQELSWLLEIAEEVGEFTDLEIEQDQENYWRDRLTNQADLSRAAIETGIDPGVLASMLQANLIERRDTCDTTPGNLNGLTGMDMDQSNLPAIKE